MNCCNAKIKNSGKWVFITEEQVASGEISINDISEIVCPYCHATGFYKSKGDKRIKHFAFVHKEDCPFIKESAAKHKIKTIYTGDIVLEDEMLYKNVNRAKTPKTNPGKSGETGEQENGELNPEDVEIKRLLNIDDGEELNDIDYGNQEEGHKPIVNVPPIDDIDMIAKYKDKIISRPIGLYKLIQKVGVYEPVLPDGRCGNDILLDDVHLQKIRRSGFNGEKKLIVAKRTGTKILKHPFDIPSGYSLLRDIYAQDIENAIFYLVKVTHDKYNNDFKKELMGEKGNRERTGESRKETQW